MLLEKGDYIALVASSNGLSYKMEDRINYLVNKLENMGLRVILSLNIYERSFGYNGSGKERANNINKFFLDKRIKAIFDISGGDLANEVLPYIDYNVISKNPKAFFGYSDLTVVLNGIYRKTGVITYNYQIRNLIMNYETIQSDNFVNTLMGNSNELFNLKYNWISGNCMEGIVVGGNIRCFLKLAGTCYMPDFNEKILFLESLSGNVCKMATALEQYKQIGAFENINGIILGTFTEMEREGYELDIVSLLRNTIKNYNIPIVKTCDLGHGQDAKAIKIGGFLSIKKESF